MKPYLKYDGLSRSKDAYFLKIQKQLQKLPKNSITYVA